MVIATFPGSLLLKNLCQTLLSKTKGPKILQPLELPKIDGVLVMLNDMLTTA